jgi:phosphopantetheinyl transferase (holo-ACP synthase)
MIGIDITNLSRFEDINLDKLGKRLCQSFSSPMHAAKYWACYEAMIKAKGSAIDPATFQLHFPKEKAPYVTGLPYALSLSHEGDYVVAVAIETSRLGHRNDTPYHTHRIHL